MEFARIGDATIHFDARLYPERPTVIFVNALGTDLRIWDGVVEALRRGRIGWLRYDPRGQGLSDLGEPPRGIEPHVADLAALMDRLEIGRATIAGLSVGGMIALGLSHAHPEKVERLVLCCTGGRIGTPEIWNAHIAAVETGGVAAVAEDRLQLWFSPDVYRQGGGAVALCRNMLSRGPAAGYVAISAAARDADISEAAQAVGIPVLCVAGEYDRAAPADLVRALSTLIPGAEFALLNCGHLPCVERPAELAALILDFVARNDADGPSDDSAYSRGLAVRRRTLGAAHVAAAQANATPFDADFQRFITEGAWGSVWARPHLTPRERSMITLALLAALGHDAELALHARATRNTGASPEDVKEALLHVAVYAGVPAANSAFRTVKEVFKAMKETS